jgi:hypothetical protein
MDESTVMKIDLASVAKSVAETDRRRVLVEEKLTQAQSVVEALNAESKSLQESVLDLKRDLEATTKAKDEETADLRRTIEERKRALHEFNTLATSADDVRSAGERQSVAIAAHVQEAQKALDSLDASAGKASADAKALDEMVARLRASVAQSRRDADAMESKLSSVADASKTATTAASEIQSRVADARAALEAAQSRKKQTDEACAALGAVTESLRVKASEAMSAVNAVDGLLAEQTLQSSTLATRLADVANLVGPPEHHNGSNGAAKPSNGTPVAAGAKHDYTHAVHAVELLALERLITAEEAERIVVALRSGDGERALRETWALTTGGAMPSAHRLVFGEVLSAMGDLKAAIIYYEQAAAAKNAPPLIRYLASIAYVRMDLLDRSTYVGQLLARDRGGKLLAKIAEALRVEHAGNPDYAAHMLSDAAGLRGFPKWEYDELHVRLGGLQERRNDIDAAVAAYEKVSGSSAPYRDVVERVRALF